jgi:hypothetical protein
VIPKDWPKLYDLLVRGHKESPGDKLPSLPLILSAWHVTMTIEKQLRFKEHIQWACEHGKAEEIGRYLRLLPEHEWYHFGEL